MKRMIKATAIFSSQEINDTLDNLVKIWGFNKKSILAVLNTENTHQDFRFTEIVK